MKSKKVYLSSDAIYAFIDRADPKHVHAAAFFRFFAQENYQLFTSIISINDTYSKIYQNISPSVAKDFLKALSLSAINLIYPEESDVNATFKTLLSYQNHELTFTEALMAVLANKKNIPQICTFNYLHSLFGLTTFYLPI